VLTGAHPELSPPFPQLWAPTCRRLRIRPRRAYATPCQQWCFAEGGCVTRSRGNRCRAWSSCAFPIPAIGSLSPSSWRRPSRRQAARTVRLRRGSDRSNATARVAAERLGLTAVDLPAFSRARSLNLAKWSGRVSGTRVSNVQRRVFHDTLQHSVGVTASNCD
jgi:hypothetical protein